MPAGPRTRVAVVLSALLVVMCSRRARAQACCSGAGAVTPGRLAIHEDALAGVQARAGSGFGSFRDDGRYASASATEWDLEQDVFGAVRLARRAQAALLAPVVETYRRAGNVSDSGGGLGDLNLSARFDFVLAGESAYVPGIAALAGVTFPTGRPDDASDQASHPLVADATGVGVYQFNFGLALEQLEGPWLFGLTGLASTRTSRTVQGVSSSVGAQWSVLAAVAYTFTNEAALALVASYAVQVDAGAALGRKMPLGTLSFAYPLTPAWRLQAGVFVTPPISGLGRNTTANAGTSFTVLRTWS